MSKELFEEMAIMAQPGKTAGKLRAELRNHIEAMENLIDAMPDKGDKCESSQKVCLMLDLMSLSASVNGITVRDMIPNKEDW